MEEKFFFPKNINTKNRYRISLKAENKKYYREMYLPSISETSG